MVKVISIASQKGGVGKTTTVLNLGFSLCCLGQKVLLVDGDPQGGMTVASNLKKRTERGLVNLLRGDSTVEDVVIPTKYDTMCIVGTGASEPKDVLFFEKQARAGNLRKVIHSVSEGYDYALVDCPAGVGSIAVVLLAMSNSVLIPMNCRTLAIKTFPTFLNLTKNIKAKINPDLRLEGVVITMLDDQNPSELKMCEELKESFSGEVFFDTMIPFDTNFEKSNASAVPVAMIPEAKEAVRSYMDLAMELKMREMNYRKTLISDEQFEGLF